MVRWDADKNAYITGAVLAELKMTISNEVVQAVLDAWPTSTLGEAPTPRALKDQVKKLSSASTALGPSSTTTGVKKSGPKAAAAAAGKKVAITGKKGAAKGKKRGRQHDEEDEDGEKEINDEANKQGPAKKIKKEIIEREDGNDDEDEDAEA